MKKTIWFFVIIFIAIFVVHVLYTIEVIVRQPSDGWSRDITIQETLFNRRPLATIGKDDNVVMIFPFKKGEGKLGIEIFDKKLERLRENVVDVGELNYNVVSSDEIFVNGNRLFWRDKSLNKIYVGDFNGKFTDIKINSVFEDIKFFNLDNYKDTTFLATISVDGQIEIIKLSGNDIEKIKGPEMNDLIDVKLCIKQDQMYLLMEQRDSTTDFRNIYVSILKDEKWSSPIKVNEINETKINVKSSDIISDDNTIYTVLSIQGDDKSRFTYIVDGIKLKNYEQIETLKLEHGSIFGVDFFSSTPIIIGSLPKGFQVITTAPTDIDLYSRGISNVVKLSMDESGITEAELLSKSKGWSNRPFYMTCDDERYIFWNEPGLGEVNLVKGATTEEHVVERTTKVDKKVIKEALGEEIPVITSYNFLYSIGGRFLSLLPALFWLLFMFLNNEKYAKKTKSLFFIGIIIFYVFQLITMNNIYNPRAVIFMPYFLKIKGSRIIFPTIFTFIGWCATKLRDKDSEVKEGYKVYMTFLIFSYLLMNYLYSPYLFK